MDMDFALPAPSAPRPFPSVERAAAHRPAGRTLYAGEGESPVPEEVRAKLRTAAKDFEATFLGQMLAPMFAEVHKDNEFAQGPGEEMFRGLLVNEYGKQIAQGGGLGIADSVYRELLRAQEAQYGGQ